MFFFKVEKCQDVWETVIFEIFVRTFEKLSGTLLSGRLRRWCILVIWVLTSSSSISLEDTTGRSAPFSLHIDLAVVWFPILSGTFFPKNQWHNKGSFLEWTNLSGHSKINFKGWSSIIRGQERILSRWLFYEKL
jgi:hypothetical protein